MPEGIVIACSPVLDEEMEGPSVSVSTLYYLGRERATVRIWPPIKYRDLSISESIFSKSNGQAVRKLRRVGKRWDNCQLLNSTSLDNSLLNDERLQLSYLIGLNRLQW